MRRAPYPTLCLHQILEIETFIPMLLQQQHKDKPSRLKRVVLIGDHNQVHVARAHTLAHT